MKLKPLTEQETDMLLVLLRKLWNDNGADTYIAQIAKSLFSLVTKKMYENN